MLFVFNLEGAMKSLLMLLIIPLASCETLSDASLVFVSWQYQHPSVTADEPLPYAHNLEEWEEK